MPSRFSIVLAAGSLLALLAALPALGQENLLTNGDFEQPVIPLGTWSEFTAIPGWTLAYGPDIEVQNHVAGSPHTGAQFVELDSYASSGIFQDIVTTSGTTYHLSFAFSPRPGTGSNDNILSVNFGSLATVLTADGSSLGDTSWTTYTYDVLATGTTTRLQFGDLGVSNTYGTYIDTVSVNANAVPEPDTFALFAAASLAGCLVLPFRRK